MISIENLSPPPTVPTPQKSTLHPPPDHLRSFSTSCPPKRSLQSSDHPPLKTCENSITNCTAAATTLLAAANDLGNAKAGTAAFSSYYDDHDNFKSAALQEHETVGFQLPHRRSLPKFSIRDYVFASRKAEVHNNWPFSDKSLQLCLKHGVKDLLPPFQALDSLCNIPIRRSSVGDNTLPEVRSSSLHKNSILPLNDQHLASDSTTAFGARQERKLAPQHCLHVETRGKEKELESNSSIPCQILLESSSWNKLPSSEHYDDREDAALAALCNSNGNPSEPSYKKTSLAIEAGSKIGHKLNDCTPMSDLTAPCELMASKVCPVCGTFSSSSNTTLNAHIDQCLSTNSFSDKKDNLQTIKPKIKPRKIRLMVDILATAPRCTLEDLDRRNGTNWNSEANNLLSEAIDAVDGVKQQRVLSRKIRDSAGDSAVYIDASGTKIRILSSFDDAPSALKSATELRVKKPSKDDGPRKPFAPDKWKRLATTHDKQIPQRKEFSHKSFSVKAGSYNEEYCAVEGFQREGKHLSPASRAVEQNNLNDSGMLKKWVRCSKRTGFSKRSTNLRGLFHSVRAVEERRVITADNGQSCLGESHLRIDVPKRSTASENCISSENSLKADEVSIEAGDSDNWCSPKRKRLNAPLCRGPKCAGMGSTRKDTVEIHGDAVEKVNRTSGSRHAFSSERRESLSLRKDLSLPSSLPCLTQQRKGDKNNSFLMCHLNRAGEEMVQWPADVTHSDSMQDKNHNSAITSADSALGYHNQREERSIDCFDGVADKPNNGDPPSALVIRRKEARDADLHEFPAQFHTQLCTEEYQAHSFTEASAPRTEPSPSGADDDGYDTTSLKIADSVLNVCSDSSFLVIDPIPIPGPPGSDLPSPRDMETGVLRVNQSLTNSHVRCFYDLKEMVDGDSEESPTSATTTISNFMEAVSDLKNSEYCMESHPADGCGRQERENPSLSTVDTRHEEKAMRWPESVTLDVDSAQGGMISQGNGPLISKISGQSCCCSWKEGISWDAGSIRSEDHRKRSRQMMINQAISGTERPNTQSPGEKLVGSSTIVREVAACGTIPSDCDSPPSISPSTLVFRLMGKNLTIINNDKSTHAWVQPVFNNCANKRASTISEAAHGDQEPHHLAAHDCLWQGYL